MPLPNPLSPVIDTLDFTFLADRMMTTLIRGLLQNDFTLVARPIVRILRRGRNDDPVRHDQGPAPHPQPPVGPFRLGRREQSCDLLIYVPRSIESYLIDDATGSYGYSHVAVDCGEVDLSNGQPVMIESTPHVGVHRSYLDKYGPREFIRIPLAPTGIDCGKFRECIRSKLGEPYDVAEVFTWGEVDDPAKQVCSDLAADCLPTKIRSGIVHEARAGRLGRRTVSIHGPANIPAHIFVSPNGFARYFGAPKGHKIHHTDELIEPRVKHGGITPYQVVMGIIVGIGLAAGLWVLWRLLQPPSAE